MNNYNNFKHRGVCCLLARLRLGLLLHLEAHSVNY